jgi:hypothetical protein
MDRSEVYNDDAGISKILRSHTEVAFICGAMSGKLQGMFGKR